MQLEPAERSRILRVLFISLLLDLVSYDETHSMAKLTRLDFIHFHITALSFPTLVLPIPRRTTYCIAEPGLSLSECLQRVLRYTNQFKI